MKKLISLMLVLLLCTALVCPVLAADGSHFLPSASFGEDGPPDEPTIPDEPGTEPGEPGTEPGEPGTEPGQPGEDAGDAPYTGDNSQMQMMVWGGVMAISLAGIIVLTVILRKRTSETR